MKMRLRSCIGVGLVGLLGYAELAIGTPLYLTFQAESILGSAGIDAHSYIGAEYIVKAEFDESIAKGYYTGADGTVTYYDDTSHTDRFYVERILGNYISLNDNFTYFTGSPRDYRLGAWTTFDSPMENVYGSGATYGKFYYSTRVSLYTDSFDDLVSIDGFWTDQVTPSYPASFLTPNAIWMIYDRDYRPNGVEAYGTFWGSLVSVSTTNLLSVPEPPMLLTISTCLAGLVAVRSRRQGKQS